MSCSTTRTVAGLLVTSFGACMGCIPQPVAVRGGTEFGECLGYCLAELDVRETMVRHTFMSNAYEDSQFPDILIQGQITESEWNAILAAVPLDGLTGLPTIIGCPDCADGGSEWIELDYGVSTQRVTFEFGAVPEGLEDLLNLVREIRERFPREETLP